MLRRGLLMAGLMLAGTLLISNVHAAEPGAATVNIDNFSFAPATLTVAVGTSVTWENRDDIPHTVTDAATKRAFKSAALDTGDKFAFTFTKPGTYHYFCSLHPHMQGTVVVK